AKQSLPRPHDTGSTSVIVAAAAIAASMALPPLSSMRNPACAASGCDVDTTLRANCGMRNEGYGLAQSNVFMAHRLDKVTKEINTQTAGCGQCPGRPATRRWRRAGATNRSTLRL